MGNAWLYAGEPPPRAASPPRGTPSWRGKWALAAGCRAGRPRVPTKWLEKDLDCTVRGRILPEAKLS